MSLRRVANEIVEIQQWYSVLLHTPRLTWATKLGYNLSLLQTPPTVLSESMIKTLASGLRRKNVLADTRPYHPVHSFFLVTITT